MRRPASHALILGILLLVWHSTCQAASTTWDGSDSSDWFDANNWSAGVPGADDDAFIVPAGNDVLLTNSTPALRSVTITNKTITFTNWSTTLTASNVVIQNAGEIALPGPFTDVQMSNRIHIVCSNLTLETGGSINADARGYAGANNGYGPGGGLNATDRGGGGAYGGDGGDGMRAYGGGDAYGTVAAPLQPGSGGGRVLAGNGGGAIRIDATDTVTIRGTISANGGPSGHSNAGGGSGGAIYITCSTFAGSALGLIQANGGNSGSANGGGGGGGRIAVIYSNTVPSQPQVRYSTSPGTGFATFNMDQRCRHRAGMGTVYLSDTAALSPVLTSNLFTDVGLYIASTTSWSVDGLTISNCSVTFAENGFQLIVTNNIVIDSAGTLGMGTDTELHCGGNLVLTNSGYFYAYAGPTNAGPDYGALVSVTGDVRVASGSWIYPYSDNTNGGSALFRMSNLLISSNAGINASGKGYAGAQTATHGSGPGRGIYYSDRGGGGGYGGAGGRGGKRQSVGGGTYGLTNAPTSPGSGGARAGGGAGGGLIRIEASGTITLDGTLMANGTTSHNGNAGAGSGGAVNISCTTFGGSNGVISVNGGNNTPSQNSGGGGGGRIRLSYGALAAQTPSVRFSASRGIGYANGNWDNRWQFGAEHGTLYLSDSDLLSPILSDQLFNDVYLYIPGFTSWDLDTLVVSNVSFILAEPGFSLTVTNDIMINNASLGLVDGSVLNCGSLTLTNNASLFIYAGETNAIPDYGALVSVTGALNIASNSWVFPYSHPTNGGSALFRVGSMYADAGSGFNAYGRGFASDYGPGKGVRAGDRGGGGGYGGQGGDGQSGSPGGNPYGMTNAPLHPGSAGGRYGAAGQGGGLVRIEAGGNVTLNGTIDADGGVQAENYSGNGSGGGIFIMCDTFQGGPNGVLTAKGGSGGVQAGSGGGGRISIAIGLSDSARSNLLADTPIPGLYLYDDHTDFEGITSVTNGTGYLDPPDPAAGYPGSQVFITTNFSLTVTGDPADYGAPFPHGYGTTIDIPRSSMVTNDVISPADESNGTRRACIGWDLQDAGGTPVDSGTTTQTVFQLNTNLIQTWNWTNEYQLTAFNGANGTVNTAQVNGWYTNGVMATNITATPSNGFVFILWLDDIPVGKETDNPVSVMMDQPRQITPHFGSSAGEVKIWSGIGTWVQSTTNWSPAGMPGPNDTVIIQSGTVTLDIPTTMKFLTVTNGATMVLTNWSTILTVSDTLTVDSGGEITLPPEFTNTQMSNRIHIVCSNLTVVSGGLINAAEKGYTSAATGHGPGGGLSASDRAGGAGYGGDGGDGIRAYGGGDAYGLTNAPTQPGSGGGRTGGGHGGGAILIDAAANVTIAGTITADGGNSSTGNAGGGSGGAIMITCATFGGSGGSVQSDGGNSGGQNSGGGSGGRIALIYDSVVASPTVRFSAAPGTGFSTWDPDVRSRYAAQAGTIYLTDLALVTSPINGGTVASGRLHFRDVASWTLDSLIVTNSSVVFMDSGFILTVTNNMVIGAGGNLGIGPHGELHCGGNLTITNGGSLTIYSGPTNGTGISYGALVSVTGDMRTASGSWVYPYSDLIDGGSVLFKARSLQVGTNSGFSATCKGYTYGQGPGYGRYVGDRGGGGGYGGKGGRGSNASSFGGDIYGATNAPSAPGSGGGRIGAGCGGGVVQIEIRGAVVLDGSILANGAPSFENYGGGGSGGSIWIDCVEFEGSANGSLQATGDNGGGLGGGAGGGRIAVWIGVTAIDRAKILANQEVSRLTITNLYVEFFGALSVTNGTGNVNPPDSEAAGPGTIVFLIIPPPAGTIFILR